MAIECYELKIEGVARGMHIQNVLHFNCDNDNDATSLVCAEELLGIWEDDVMEWWLDLVPNVYAVRWVSARRVVPKHSNTAWREYPGGTKLGTRGTEVGPTAVAPIIKLYGGLDTPIQGRIFLPPPGENVLVNNEFSGGYTDAVLALIEHFLNVSDVHDFNLAILSRKTGTGYGVSQAALGPVIGQIGGRRRPL